MWSLFVGKMAFFVWLVVLILNLFVKGMERLVFGSFHSNFGVSGCFLNVGFKTEKPFITNLSVFKKKKKGRGGVAF